MNKLRIVLTLLPHPYPDTPEAGWDAWGEIAINIVTDDTNILLYQTQWEMSGLAEWFIENHRLIATEPLEIKGDKPWLSESISQALDRFREQELDVDADFEWYDVIYHYCSHHNLWFGLIGSIIPDILIGCNHGVGEISLGKTDNSDGWSYQFDMEDFIANFIQEIERMLRKWRKSLDGEPLKRCDDLLSRLALC